MTKTTLIEYDAARSFGISVNAMAVFAAPVSNSYCWKKSLEFCSRSELQLLLDFLQDRNNQGYPGYKSRIKKIQTRLDSIYCV